MLFYEFLAMNELGDICGLTQKEMGLALARLGLWIIDHRPTDKAIAAGLIQWRDYPHRPDIGDRKLATWHVGKTLAALKTIGIEPLPEFAATVSPPASPKASSPAPKPRARQSYMNKHGD